MVHSLFGAALDCSQVRVHHRGYLWLGLQPSHIAMAPDGHVYFKPPRFREDFSRAPFAEALGFMHEMVHVWQHQIGYPVKWRGALRVGLSYRYTLEAHRRLCDYDMEAQGNLLSDYWALKSHAPGRPPCLWEPRHAADLALYEQVLAPFLADPRDRGCLPR